MNPRLVVVTDPMCSWCFAASRHVENAMAAFAGRVDFDLILGGINTHATQAIGEYGQKRLDGLWHQVTATTGQEFSHIFPEGCIYNSLLPCRAVEAARDLLGEPPLNYLHRLQKCFFLEAVNINDRDALASEAAEFGIDVDDFLQRLDSAEVATRTQWGFARSRRQGAGALPSFLFGRGDDLTLMAGGYLDTEFLCTEIEARLA